MTKGVNEYWFNSLLLGPAQNQPVPTLLPLVTFMHLGETVSWVKLEELCDSLYLAPKVPSERVICGGLGEFSWYQGRESCGRGWRGNGITFREGAVLWAAVRDRSSPYLVEAAAQRAIMSSRSGGLSGRATGDYWSTVTNSSLSTSQSPAARSSILILSLGAYGTLHG